MDRSEERHEFTFFVPLGVQAQDVDVQEMKGREFDAAYTEALDRRLSEDWIAQQTYRDRVNDAVLPGALLLNGGVPAWLSALIGQQLYERRPTIEGDFEAGQVFETPSGRVAVYDMDDSVDVEALIAEEGLPESVRETLEAVWGQRLAVVTLVTNPEAEAGELTPPEPEVKTLRLWDVVSGQEIPTSLVLAETVHALAFSPDGSHLAAAISDEYVVIWNVTADEPIATILLGGIGTKSLAFSLDNTTLAIAKVRSVELWDVATGQLMTRIRSSAELGSARVAACAPGGTWVALGYGKRVSDVEQEEESETGLRLSWTSTMQPGASGALIHRYPLGTGQSWANPIPLTRVYVVAAPGIGFEVQAPVIGEDYSGFVPGKYGRPRLRIYDAPRNQSAYAMDSIVTPDGQLWRSIYTGANPAEDVVITRREPLTLPLHYAPPALARHVWRVGLGVALLAWLLAWRYLMGGVVAVPYTWFGKPFWRDSLHWLTAGHVRSLAFLPFLLVGLFAGFEFVGETPAWSSLFYLSPLILLAHGMTAYRFARSVHQPAETFDWLRNKAFWGFLVVAVVSNVLYMALAYAAVVYLGEVE